MGNLDKIKKLDQEIEAPADFTSPEVLYNELIAAIRKYHPSDDISMIEKAYQIAYDAHKDQRRKSGEPYIIHPLCVAIILADLELDKETLVAGILHSTLSIVHEIWVSLVTPSTKSATSSPKIAVISCYQADPDLVDDR